MAAKYKAARKVVKPVKRAVKKVAKKQVKKKLTEAEEMAKLFGDDLTKETPEEREGTRGRPRAVEFSNDGVQLGINLFAQEVILNSKTVSDRLRKAGVKAAAVNNMGIPMYRLRDLINATILSDDSGKLDVDKLPPIQRHAHYKAETERQKMLEASGQLVEAGEVEKEMARQAKIITQFCDTLPDILERDCELTAGQLAKVESIVDMLRKDIHKQMIGD